MDNSVRLPQMQDPNAYANYYAQQNNMSLDEAKTQLQEQYGDPQEPQDVSSLFDTTEDSTTSGGFEYNEDEYQAIFGGIEESGNSVSSFFEDMFDTFGDDNDGTSAKRQDPDEQAQEYADEHGLSLEEAKAELLEKYGDPEEKDEEEEDEE